MNEEKPSHLSEQNPDSTDWRAKGESYWQQVLSPEQFKVCRQGGTEHAFSGKYYKDHRDGAYYCSNCGQKLFSSGAKFDSGTGWPSFYEPADKKNITLHDDRSHGMARTEVKCARCGAHLGHLFPDGPKPTGMRYCINSISLIHEDDMKK